MKVVCGWTGMGPLIHNVLPVIIILNNCYLSTTSAMAHIPGHHREKNPPDILPNSDFKSDYYVNQSDNISTIYNNRNSSDFSYQVDHMDGRRSRKLINVTDSASDLHISGDNGDDGDRTGRTNSILKKAASGHINNFGLVPYLTIPSRSSRGRRVTSNAGDHLEREQRFFQLSSPSPVYQVTYPTAFINGLRIEAVEKGVTYEDGGVSAILADVPTTIRLFGWGFSNRTEIRFATELKSYEEDCDDTSSTRAYPLLNINANATSAILHVVFPASRQDEYYFVCVRENLEKMPWIHQGPDPWLRVKAYERLLPFWLQAVLIAILLMLSGLFAGLTLGLLALDRTDLKILANTGSEKERNYAKTILPLRSRGNYLLCSLVLGNVLVNSTLTILLDDLTSGLFAVMLSTAGIVIFGEIIPQAVCSRNGLAIGAKTVWVTKFIMLITFPLSYTFSVLLDKILGEEIGLVYNREKLKELIAVTLEHNQLETDEVNIISGALEMRKKTVETIMTRLEDVFMLPIEGVLDFELLSEIRKQGYSRIPIYEQERSNIVSLLFTKDLLFVDPDDRIPLKTLAEFYKNPCYFIFSDTTLDVVFREFKECKRGGHMAFVQRVNATREDKDPYCETIGLVTLEDVIEEMIQSEIVDETDVWMDNRSKRRIPPHEKQDFSKFMEIRNSQKTISISPQLALAAFQFLSTVVEPFKSQFVSESILHRLLKKQILFRIPKPKDSKIAILLYEHGKASDCFTLILEGRVEVITGTENLMFETGPFAYFGVPALLSTGDVPFVPDYTVRATSDLVVLRVRRSLYLAALQATILEKAKTYGDATAAEVQQDLSIEEQIERVLRTVDSEVNLNQMPAILPPPPDTADEGGGETFSSSSRVKGSKNDNP